MLIIVYQLLGIFLKKKQIFDSYHVDSSLFDIFIVDNLSEELCEWNINNVKKKVMVVTHNSKSIAFPLINS